MTSKDLIQQYVDTGISIPEYQISQLNKTKQIENKNCKSKLMC